MHQKSSSSHDLYSKEYNSLTDARLFERVPESCVTPLGWEQGTLKKDSPQDAPGSTSGKTSSRRQEVSCITDMLPILSPSPYFQSSILVKFREEGGEKCETL